ncbi:hypothetical protein ALQ23_200212 [Pseudomonas syringae pv. antirrhini]|nr:hypothetical protein ALQ23_200212 [Pseudomonas syringae pv. antirrhini]
MDKERYRAQGGGKYYPAIVSPTHSYALSKDHHSQCLTSQNFQITAKILSF